MIGNYHVARQDLGFNFDVDVTCMAVVGDTAWMGGIIRKVNGPIVIAGTVSYFYVIDKGEGNVAPVDIASAIRVNDRDGEDRVFCNSRPTLLARAPSTSGMSRCARSKGFGGGDSARSGAHHNPLDALV